MKKNKHNLKKTIQNQSGFTLLEIIAVLVILGILSVVAIPKYFDLQVKAREKAMDAAVAEVMGRINGYFAQQILEGHSPEDIRYNSETLGTDTISDDFTVTFNHEDGADQISFTITPKDPGPLAGEGPRTPTPFARPGV